jgi:intergrase/recombinase
MARTKYFIKLSDAERNLLTQIVCEGTEPAKKIMRARILLMSDTAQSKKYSLTALAELLGTTDTTIQTVRTEYATLGLETTLQGKRSKPRGHYSRFNQDTVKALKELAKEEPPQGHKKWSSRLLCEEAVKRGIVDSITPSTMLRIIGEDETK